MSYPATTSAQSFSETEMRRYFTKPSFWPIVWAALGVILLISGLASGNNGGCLVTLGLIIAVASGIVLYFNFGTRRPTDAEYDAWVLNRLTRYEPHALEKLSLRDPSQIVSPRLRVDGFIFPNVSAAAAYGDVRLKVGKDGITRFSINTVKFFYPTEHNLAAYSNIADALRQSRTNEKTEEFFYDDIVGAKTQDVSDNFTITSKSGSGKSGPVRVSLKMFMVIASSGDTTGETVGVRSENDSGLQLMRSGDVVDQTVNSLRTLLREKKGGAQQEQARQQQQQAQMQNQMQQAMLEQMKAMQEQMMRMQQTGTGGPAPDAQTSTQPPADGTAAG